MGTAKTHLWGLFEKTKETRGMDTVERPVGPNGEVSKPSRSFRVFVET